MRPQHSARKLAALVGDEPPTAQQVAAIEAPVSPTLIVAGAGSGKTTTMAARVVWLIANGYVTPQQILGLTFTRKAAAELSRKVRKRLRRLAANAQLARLEGEPLISTYHSYASGIVSEHGPRGGIDAGTAVLSSARAWQLAYAAVTQYDGDMSHVTHTVDSVVDNMMTLSDELAEHLTDAQTLELFTAETLEDIADKVHKPTKDLKSLLSRFTARVQLLPIVAKFDEHKRRAGAVDYSDQLAFAAQVAQDCPEVGEIERDRYRVVLLDEYQDTSHSQVTLLRALFGGGHPVTAVGDPCQSIYTWRGASAGTLTRFPTDFRDRDDSPAIQLPLSTSWRNRKRILRAANALSKPLRDGGLQVPRLEPGVDGDGAVKAALLDTTEDEAQWIADRIAQAWEASPTPPTTAVLVRKRKQIPRIEARLRARGLPVEVIGVGGLLDAPEAKEVQAMLTVLARPTSGPALMRLLTGPRWRIGPRDIAALHSRAKELAPRQRGFEPSADALDEATLAEALEDPGDDDNYSAAAVDRFASLRRELEWLRSRTNQPLTDLIADIIDVSGLEIEVTVHQGDTDKLSAFMQEAAQYSATSPLASLDGFLSYLEVAADRERGIELAGATERSGTVQIMTVHAAKGLEWDLVAVPGLAASVFPGKSRGNWLSHVGKLPYPLRGDAAELPTLDLRDVDSSASVLAAVKQFREKVKEQHELEERRLAYVALTRAHQAVMVSGYWWDEDADGARGPSTFLDEIAAYAETDTWAPEPSSASNPMRADAPQATWPVLHALGDRHDTVMAAAEAVRNSDGAVHADPRAQRWAREAQLLLAERARTTDNVMTLPIPRTLSVSQLVAWHDDSQEFAQNLRRPVPTQPAPHMRRGTTFHAWVEQHFRGGVLFDLEDLPGAADVDVHSDEELEALCEAFARSSWASRTPVAVEVPFSTVIDTTVIRGRIDAVFATSDGGYEVVDWKTGRPPTGRSARAAAIQLAAYRKAWAALRGVDESQVGSAFHYVRHNHTVRPQDLPDLAAVFHADTDDPASSDS